MQLSRNVEGVNTDVLLQSFADRVLILVTQLGKVGNLIQATIPATAHLRPPIGDTIPEPPAAIQLTHLFGSAPTEHLATLHSLYASQIATIVWYQEQLQEVGDRRGVVVGLALKKTEKEGGDAERQTFLQVMRMVMELLQTSR